MSDILITINDKLAFAGKTLYESSVEPLLALLLLVKLNVWHSRKGEE